jgi:hypothetical protein
MRANLVKGHFILPPHSFLPLGLQKPVNLNLGDCGCEIVWS